MSEPDVVADLKDLQDGFREFSPEMDVVQRAIDEIVALRAERGKLTWDPDRDEIVRLRAALERNERQVRAEALEEAARLHEQINPACDHERLEGHPGAGAMGAVIKYRDAIRALKRKRS